LRLISAVAAPCCSTAAEIEPAISLILPPVSLMVSMAPAARRQHTDIQLRYD